MAKKLVITPLDAFEMASRVDFLTEHWEVLQYAGAIYSAYIWGKNVK